MHWFDDEVFEQCPAWKACVQAGKIPRLDLERYFGKADENGPGHYEQSVKYGIGRRVLAKALEGAETGRHTVPKKAKFARQSGKRPSVRLRMFNG